MGGSISVGATGESSNLVEVAAYSKTVTEQRTYSKGATIPSSIGYNSGGWTGNLSYQSRIDAGIIKLHLLEEPLLAQQIVQ
ncbi:MAG TPA: hypothetical protein VLQ66_06235 [Paenisporosarcina sp.]|nr:hypothetical protein [Paenisporosarcina sp.]